MMKKTGLLLSAVMVTAWQAGCIVVSSSGGCWGLGQAQQTATSELTIEASGLLGLDVRTHNGRVSYTGADSSTIVVSAKKTGRGLTSADAKAALDAIKVYVEDTGSGRKKLAWRWSTPKHATWSGGVSFSISGPENLGLDVESHNGGIDVEGVAGDVKAITHNGAVVTSTANGSLTVETHNGRIETAYSGPSITLASYNGGVSADLSGCGSVVGDIRTHNGGIRVTVGPSTASEIDCETNNGGIHADSTINVRKVSQRRLKATLGAGGSPLKVRSYNGGIHLKKVG